METLLQQLINGLVIGSVYALVALGYTMVYGILGLINFAHGEVVMVGALVAIPVCMLIGYTMERLAYRRLRNAPKLAPLITAIGVSLLLQTLAMIVWGRDYHTYPQLVSAAPFQPVEGVFISPIQLSAFVLSLLLMGGLLLLVNRTKLGRAMRATAENHRVAGLMGVDTNAVISATFIIGSGLAAVAGIMLGSMYGIAYYGMGAMPGLKAFTAAVLGGIGNIKGAMAGGLVLGLIESLGAGYIERMTFGFLNSSYQDIFAFMVLIAILVFRPSGLLGERVSDRA